MTNTTSLVLPGAEAVAAGSELIKVLVAEDDQVSRELTRSIFEVSALPPPRIVEDGAEALTCLQQGTYDILITDLNMPRLTGEELIRRALVLQPELTVMVITGYATIHRAVELMKCGVFDFLTKPYSIDTFQVSLQKAKNRVLGIHEMRGMREVVNALLVALESKDRYLQGHAARVSLFAGKMGKLLGMGRNELKLLEFAALLHDVGKIGIHEDILNKPGKLTAEEFEIMKRHPVMSRDIIAPVAFLGGCLPSVLHHHERMDGKGYPQGIGGAEIPLGARVISVVDAFDAMSSERSYRTAKPLPVILNILREVAGGQLDRSLVELFLANLHGVTGYSMPEEER